MNDTKLAARREKKFLFLLGVICLALIGGAVYLQVALGEQPCPLCILQRYALLLIAVFSFVGVLMRSRFALNLSEALAWFSAIGGLGVAARHVYIQWFPLTSCGIDVLQPIVDGLPLAKAFPLVFKVDGFCETLYPPILGLSLAQWALLAFALTVILLPLGIIRNRRRASSV